MIQLTTNAANNQNLNSVGILASSTTIASHLYSEVKNQQILNLKDQAVTLKIIHGVISGKMYAGKLQEQIDVFLQRGCSKVILGCSELSVINYKANLKNVIDPLVLVTEEIMKDTV